MTLIASVLGGGGFGRRVGGAAMPTSALESGAEQASERVAEEPAWFDDDAYGWESWSGR